MPSTPDEPFDAIRNAIAKRFETIDARGVNSEPPPTAWRFRLASICSQPDEVDQLIQVHRAYVERMYRMDASDSAALLSAACRASHWDAALAILEGHRKLQLFDIDAHQLDWVVQGLGAAKQRGHLERVRALVPALLESADEVSSAHCGIDALLAGMESGTVVDGPGMEPGDGEPVGDGASASAEASEK
jgi:hypothetical protein